MEKGGLFWQVWGPCPGGQALPRNQKETKSKLNDQENGSLKDQDDGSVERAPTPAQTSVPRLNAIVLGYQRTESCWEVVSLQRSPGRPAAHGDPSPSFWAGEQWMPSIPRLRLDGKRPGGGGKQALRRPRCRIAAPSGLLMGLAEPRCLRPGPCRPASGRQPGRPLARPGLPGLASPESPRLPGSMEPDWQPAGERAIQRGLGHRRLRLCQHLRLAVVAVSPGGSP